MQGFIKHFPLGHIGMAPRVKLEERSKKFAVVRTGAQQFLVREGDTIKVQSLSGKPGSTVELDQVIAAGTGEEGSTLKCRLEELKSVKVEAKILAQGRDKKVIIFKKRRRKGYTKKQGHRQGYTTLQITNLSL